MRQIIVTVSADGTVGAETSGITGEACLDYIGILEDLLDARTTGSRFTDDYRRSVVSSEAGAVLEERDVDNA